MLLRLFDGRNQHGQIGGIVSIESNLNRFALFSAVRTDKRFFCYPSLVRMLCLIALIA